MKSTVCKVPSRPAIRVPYPNAATRRELLHKVLDLALVIASGVGMAAIFALLTVL